jgi:hypothetical protein
MLRRRRPISATRCIRYISTPWIGPSRRSDLRFCSSRRSRTPVEQSVHPGDVGGRGSAYWWTGWRSTPCLAQPHDRASSVRRSLAMSTQARRPTVAFIGWFGRRGLASNVFAVIVEDTYHAHAGTILTACYVTVGLSVVRHDSPPPHSSIATTAGIERRWARTSRRWRANRPTSSLRETPAWTHVVGQRTPLRSTGWCPTGRRLGPTGPRSVMSPVLGRRRQIVPKLPKRYRVPARLGANLVEGVCELE